MIIKIKKPRFKKLEFFIFFTNDILVILKITIFIDNFKIADEIATYLLY